MGRGLLLWLIGVPIPVIFYYGCFSAAEPRLFREGKYPPSGLLRKTA